MAVTKRRAGYPTAVVWKAATGETPVNHLLWGDWLEVTGPAQRGRVPVRARGDDGWMDARDIQDEALLELIFVDIGQGDGCLVVTPDDRALLVDAGAGDAMSRFLSWRFGGFRRRFTFDAFVITHADLDHYGGFAPLLAHEQVHVKRVFHNGLVERAGAELLGPKTRADGRQYLTDVVRDHDRLERLLARPAAWKGKKYPTMLRTALESGRVGPIAGLGVAPGEGSVWVPGYDPASRVALQVLGPAWETVGGEPALRWLGDAGKTKNGHSVVLRLTYGNLAVLLGGDLNVPAEQWLLERHTGLEVPPTSLASEDEIVAGARRVFGSEFAKSCHHGSADFTHLFLRAVDPVATVVSSGDDEPHAHPRSDTLGAIGRFSRGSRPLIFSTELARSAAERILRPSAVRDRFRKAKEDVKRAAVAGDAERLARAEEGFEALLGTYLERSVAVYGAINLRSDGRRAVMAYRIERPRDAGHKWDAYLFEPDRSGQLRYRSKHEEA